MFDCKWLLLIFNVMPLLWGRDWRIEDLHSENLLEPSIQTMIDMNVIFVGHWGKLLDVQSYLHSRNSWVDGFDGVDDDNLIVPGTTLWIHEWMAIGHAQYDMEIIEVLASTRVDRIVLQRAPCHSPESDLCVGVGTWLSWFQGFYALAIHTFRPGIPIFVRFNATDTLDSYYLSISEAENGALRYGVRQVKGSETLVLNTDMKPFQRLIRKNYDCEMCFAKNLISPSTAEKFKNAAHEYSLSQLDTQDATAYDNGPIIIKHLYRPPNSRRHMSNVDQFSERLKQAFRAPQYEVQSTKTSTVEDDGGEVGLLHQVQQFRSAHVLIMEHGAGETNVIFCRNGTLVIDLIPVALTRQAEGPHVFARNLAKSFGVLFEHVVLSNQPTLGTPSFDITEHEIDSVVEMIRDYVVNALPVLKSIRRSSGSG